MLIWLYVMTGKVMDTSPFIRSCQDVRILSSSFFSIDPIIASLLKLIRSWTARSGPSQAVCSIPSLEFLIWLRPGL